jgi:hypothetical protein
MSGRTRTVTRTADEAPLARTDEDTVLRASSSIGVDRPEGMAGPPMSASPRKPGAALAPTVLAPPFCFLQNKTLSIPGQGTSLRHRSPGAL